MALVASIPSTERLAMHCSRTLLLALGFTVGSAAAGETGLRWQSAASLPDRVGFAGMFAGVCGERLIAAGGANFPGKPPWEGGTKVWYDRVFVLDRPDGRWRTAGIKLPRPLAYGVSITWKNSLICIGGGDARQHYADVFALSIRGEKLAVSQLPSLPKPCAQMCGAIVGDRIYVAGGLEAPDSVEPLHVFWTLDLSQLPANRRWRELKPLPGWPRFQSVAGSDGKAFYLFGGIRLRKGKDGKAERIAPYLREAWRFAPAKSGTGGRWARLADMPRGVAAAPSPALRIGNMLVIAGGVDGSMLNVPQDKHPGFTRATTAFDLSSKRFAAGPKMPAGVSRVTAPAVRWKQNWWIISGESAPGRRSPKVYRVELSEVRN